LEKMNPAVYGGNDTHQGSDIESKFDQAC
jgi:hypothetical protein